MSIRSRLLGFAFASSDLLLELDAGRSVVFGLGSGPSAELSAESFTGVALEQRVAPISVEPLKTLLQTLRPGTRSAAIDVLFLAGAGRMRRASARFFVLPDLAPNVSCSVTWEGPAYPLHNPAAAPALEPEAFLSRAKEMLAPPAPSRDLSVAFVEVEGLAAAQTMGEAGERLNARVEAALQAASADGASAGKLGPERFALLRDRADETDLAGEVNEIGRSEGFDLSAKALETDLAAAGGSLNALRALRVAVEGCLNDTGPNQPELTFSAALSRTLTEAHAFQSMVRDRRFDLHYQPIVDLKTGAVHHFEALSRFKGAASPANAIRMAEEMALIDSFDIAVAEKALSRLRQQGAGLLKFAINVSGASLADDRYVQALLRMTLGQAGRAQAADRRGHRVGRPVRRRGRQPPSSAGCARPGSRSVLMTSAPARPATTIFGGLSVDTVKIDGSFVQGLETDPRARTLIGHLVELCRSLKVETIAEMIETQAAADILRDVGVDQGQGWLFGKAEAEPRTILAGAEPVAARRMGAVAGWG